jgi:hypothetical protein
MTKDSPRSGGRARRLVVAILEGLIVSLEYLAAALVLFTLFLDWMMTGAGVLLVAGFAAEGLIALATPLSLAAHLVMTGLSGLGVLCGLFIARIAYHNLGWVGREHWARRMARQ